MSDHKNRKENERNEYFYHSPRIKYIKGKERRVINLNVVYAYIINPFFSRKVEKTKELFANKLKKNL